MGFAALRIYTPRWRAKNKDQIKSRVEHWLKEEEEHGR